MEIMIELTEADLEQISGGVGEVSRGGAASFSFSDTASGTTAAVSGTLNIATTASSASLSGSFSSSST